MTIRTSVGLLLLLGAVGCESANIPRAPEVGAMVPQYAALTMAGDSISLSEHEGEVVLLNVWATWCLPCREEIPVLQALHERHGWHHVAQTFSSTARPRRAASDAESPASVVAA